MLPGPVDDPAAWTAREVSGCEGLTLRLSADQIDAIDRLVEATRGRRPHEIARSDFSSPPVDALMATVRGQLHAGRGAVILSGIDAGRYDLDGHERLYWGLGTHVGTGVMQSPRREFIAHVQKEEGGAGRGYTTDMELRPHTDFHEILSLYSLRTAPEGGESSAVSLLAVHNSMARERPDLLAALYRGWPMDLPWRTRPVDEAVPFFWRAGDRTSGFNNRVFLRDRQAPMRQPAELREALALFDAIAQREELHAQFLLEPGDMFFWHNFLVLHARRRFHDAPDRRRLLLRLWLNVPGGRPIHPAMARLTAEIDAYHAGEPIPA